MFSSAICNGNVNNYSQTFDDLSHDVWSTMISDYDNNTWRECSESVLIAYVGSLVQMNYGNNGSGANTETLKSNVFEQMGISCNYGSYNENTVKSSLLSGKPIIVSAYSSFWGDGGHCFVIDGYKRTRTKTTTYYDWIPTLPSNPSSPIIEHNSYATVSYSAPHISYIQINWGWWDQWTFGANDGWYSLTGSWYTQHESGSTANYDYYRNMIYGFSLN